MWHRRNTGILMLFHEALGIWKLLWSWLPFTPTHHVIRPSLGLYFPSFSAHEARPKFPLFLETQIYLQTSHPSSPGWGCFVSALGKSFSIFMSIIFCSSIFSSSLRLLEIKVRKLSSLLAFYHFIILSLRQWTHGSLFEFGAIEKRRGKRKEGKS